MYSSVTTDPTAASGAAHFVAANGGEECCNDEAVVGIAELAQRPAWSAARVVALPGRCRGSVLARWAGLVRRHFGDAAVRRVRAELGPLAAELPDDPPDEDWFPVGVQIRLTDVFVREFLGGDPRLLQPLLAEDVKRQVGRAAGLFLRTVGPGPILGRARHIHPSLYDVGHADADVGSGHAIIDCTGAELFANPTWQILQLMAHAGFVELTGRKLISILASAPADDALRIDLRWA
jgi:hypothetical protein